jgi:hypothetical protein
MIMLVMMMMMMNDDGTDLLAASLTDSGTHVLHWTSLVVLDDDAVADSLLLMRHPNGGRTSLHMRSLSAATSGLTCQLNEQRVLRALLLVSSRGDVFHDVKGNETERPDCSLGRFVAPGLNFSHFYGSPSAALLQGLMGAN